MTGYLDLLRLLGKRIPLCFLVNLSGTQHDKRQR